MLRLVHFTISFELCDCKTLASLSSATCLSTSASCLTESTGSVLLSLSVVPFNPSAMT